MAWPRKEGEKGLSVTEYSFYLTSPDLTHPKLWVSLREKFGSLGNHCLDNLHKIATFGSINDHHFSFHLQFFLSDSVLLGKWANFLIPGWHFKKGGVVPEEESDTELEALSQPKHLSRILLNLTSENTKAEGPKSSYTGKHMALERRS